MDGNKTIRRVTDPGLQQAETNHYWQSLSVGERLSAVWDASSAAFSFAAAFRGDVRHDAQGPQRSITRIQRTQR